MSKCVPHCEQNMTPDDFNKMIEQLRKVEDLIRRDGELLDDAGDAIGFPKSQTIPHGEKDGEGVPIWRKRFYVMTHQGHVDKFLAMAAAKDAAKLAADAAARAHLELYVLHRCNWADIKATNCRKAHLNAVIDLLSPPKPNAKKANYNLRTAKQNVIRLVNEVITKRTAANNGVPPARAPAVAAAAAGAAPVAAAAGAAPVAAALAGDPTAGGGADGADGEAAAAAAAAYAPAHSPSQNLALYMREGCDWTKIPGARKRVADVFAVIKLLAPDGFTGSGPWPPKKAYRKSAGRKHVEKLVSEHVEKLDEEDDDL